MDQRFTVWPLQSLSQHQATAPCLQMPRDIPTGMTTFQAGCSHSNFKLPSPTLLTTPLSPAEQRCHTVRIVEVKCTYAFNFEEKIRQARDQHDLLSANFLAAGWPVERFEIVLDHTGIVSNLTVGALAALGLPTSERAILIRQLQCLCIRSAFSMHTTRIALLHAYTSDPSSPVPYYDGVT